MSHSAYTRHAPSLARSCVPVVCGLLLSNGNTGTDRSTSNNSGI